MKRIRFSEHQANKCVTTNKTPPTTKSASNPSRNCILYQTSNTHLNLEMPEGGARAFALFLGVGDQGRRPRLIRVDAPLREEKRSSAYGAGGYLWLSMTVRQRPV